MNHPHLMNHLDLFALAKAKNLHSLTIKFCDIAGAWQHFSLPFSALKPSDLSQGLSLDGSSIKGWKGVEASDMLVVADPSTAFVDPFFKYPTLSVIGDVYAIQSSESYHRSPRTIAKKAQAYLESTGLADTAYFGPEAEFFIFDSVHHMSLPQQQFFAVDSMEASWNSEKAGPSHGYHIPFKGGYMPVLPWDQTLHLREDMVACMLDLGLKVERQHHEVATAGQAEIDIQFDTLLKAADHICLYKYIVRNVAFKYGKTATFMPKPLFGDNGSGMHTHVSLWKEGQTLMAGKDYAGLSTLALYFIGGLLKHAAALCAICNPTNNSYKRLTPGYEAPVSLAYSAQNRSAICRIPLGAEDPKAKRIEYRCPDPAANPYLAFSAILMAGLDGIEKKIHPGEPSEKNFYKLSPEEKKQYACTPESLKEALQALEADHEFLLKGQVFTQDFLEVFTQMKLEEYDSIRLRPHPHEYALYYGV